MSVLVFACREEDPLSLAFLAQLAERGGTAERVDEDEAAIARAATGRAVFVGGFSRGARLAARVANDVDPLGLVLIGYPFHPKGRPREREALAVLARVRARSLVLQGERDVHGNRQAIRGVSERVSIEWLADGNHRLVPRAASGSSQDALIARAVTLALAFMEARAE